MAKRLILAVDFDDTISTNNQWPRAGPPKAGVKEALERLIPKYEIIIYTCRLNAESEDKPFHLSEIKNFLEKHKIPYDQIDLGLKGKIFADFYIDDKAIAFEDNWDEIYEALNGSLLKQVILEEEKLKLGINSMSHIRAHRLLSIAMQRLERGEKKKSILHAIKGAVEDLQDPFAGEIDEFLKEKQQRENPNEALRKNGEGDDPQEEAEDKLTEEEPASDDMPGDTPQDDPQEEAEDKLTEEEPASDDLPGDTPQDDPQENAEDKYDEAEEESQEADELEKRKQDIQKEIDKVQQKNEDYAESALRAIAKLAKQRGYAALANKFVKATAGGVVDILNDLLMKEYLQRDVAINYYYLFDAGHSKYLKEHFESEKGRMVYLQRCIVDFGATPTTRRLSIPPVNPLTPGAVMGLIIELEKQAVVDYLAAAKSIEGFPEYTTLKVWLEGVANEEAQDTKEMKQLA